MTDFSSPTPTRRELRAAERAAQEASGVDPFAAEREEFLSSGGIIPDTAPTIEPDAQQSVFDVPAPAVSEPAAAAQDFAPSVFDAPAAERAVAEPSVFDAPAPAESSTPAADTFPAPAEEPDEIPDTFAQAFAAHTPPSAVEPDDGSNASLFAPQSPVASTFTNSASSPVDGADDEPAILRHPVEVDPKKRKKADEETNGVNLWAAISIVASVVGVLAFFLPFLSDTGAYIAYGAIPLALIAIVLPKFKRLQSIVAIVLALGVGGYHGYTQFVAPAPAPTSKVAVVPASAKTDTLTLTVTGTGIADLSYMVANRGISTVQHVALAKLPWTTTVKVAPELSGSTSVRIFGGPAKGDMTCTIALNGKQLSTQTIKSGRPIECIGASAPVVQTPSPAPSGKSTLSPKPAASTGA